VAAVPAEVGTPEEEEEEEEALRLLRQLRRLHLLPLQHQRRRHLQAAAVAAHKPRRANSAPALSQQSARSGELFLYAGERCAAFAGFRFEPAILSQ